MADSVKKVLFVNSEMVPYLPESPVGNLCRQLPQGIQERKKEIRAFMPKYGCINERCPSTAASTSARTSCTRSSACRA